MNHLKILLRKILGEEMVNQINYFFSFRYNSKFKKYKDKKKIIHMLTPLHGNMGDQAIVYATNKFLKENFQDYKIIEVYKKDIYKYAKALKKILNYNDFIVLIGGGNMGNLWITEEIDRRFVINTFKDNKIISMPQTISFTDNKDGKKEFEITKKVYNAHNNLTLIAREEKSYKIMRDNFIKNKVILNPDTVLYLNKMYQFNDGNRNKIMTCLRSDKESVLGNRKAEFVEALNNNYNEVFNYDTVIDKTITKDIREKELKNMFDKFLNSKIVITDRLHGMVFCVITKTPCIVTKSLDHKVTGTYEWIKGLNYIKLVDDLNFETIKPLIDELINLNYINEIDFKNRYFDELSNTLKSLIK